MAADLSDLSMGQILCRRCGTEYESNNPNEPCPKCAFAHVLAPVSELTDEVADIPPDGDATGAADFAPRFRPGQIFGTYRIGRLLGRGGMGEVYEAENLLDQRRLALKVLNERLRRSDDRIRFLHEGQLAASVNHRHVVYIFGCEEIDRIPVITMELLPGGTLKDRVTAKGPLSAPEAVEAMLQVVAGLEAAQSAGILHRDIKPSNCFIDRGGKVKIGDFGLSISQLPRIVTSLDQAGAFQGTPAYAAPEQLRGAEHTLQADIYAVGATLFYLLTGHAPFDGRTRADVLARITAGPTQSARRFTRAIPKELDRFVARCLTKYPEIRPRTYGELTKELTRFTSRVPTPAPLGRRAAAGLLDAAVMIPVQGIFAAQLVGFRAVTHEGPALALALGLPMMCYGTFAEAAAGTTLGMRLCGLRALGTHAGHPDVLKAFIRNALALIPLALALVVSTRPGLAGESSLWRWLAVVGTFATATALLFVSARARNGLSAIHDRLTHTRIVLRSPAERRAAPTAPARPAPSKPSDAKIGPYDVVEPLGPTDGGELFVGYDPRLQRFVWIHGVQRETPAVPATVRDASGPARLHWLNGHRAAYGGLDVYEMPSGGPLLSATEHEPWHNVRQALIDLAEEIDQELIAGTPPVLNLDRVWLTPEGYLVLLDFRAPGAPATDAVGPATVASAQHFLHDVAARALGARQRPPLPLSASSVLERLAAGAFGTMADVKSALSATRDGADHVSFSLRFTSLAVSLITWFIGTRVLHGPGLWVSNVGGANILIALLAVFWALWLRSGFWLRIFHIAVVTPDGHEASRLRAAGRVLLAWSWVPVQIFTTIHGWSQIGGYVVLLRIIGLVWTAADPARGPHDRIAGTYLVPR
jgi:uncharacterized RDD family membrane protein YckC